MSNQHEHMADEAFFSKASAERLFRTMSEEDLSQLRRALALDLTRADFPTEPRQTFCQGRIEIIDRELQRRRADA